MACHCALRWARASRDPGGGAAEPTRRGVPLRSHCPPRGAGCCCACRSARLNKDWAARDRRGSPPRPDAHGFGRVLLALQLFSQAETESALARSRRSEQRRHRQGQAGLPRADHVRPSLCSISPSGMRNNTGRPWGQWDRKSTSSSWLSSATTWSRLTASPARKAQ